MSRFVDAVWTEPDSVQLIAIQINFSRKMFCQNQNEDSTTNLPPYQSNRAGSSQVGTSARALTMGLFDQRVPSVPLTGHDPGALVAALWRPLLITAASRQGRRRAHRHADRTCPKTSRATSTKRVLTA